MISVSMSAASPAEKLSLLSTLRADVGRLHVPPTTGSVIRCFFGRSGFQAVVFYRLSTSCFSRGLLGRIGTRLFVRSNMMFNGCEIAPGCEIGPGLKLPHPCGIVIGPCKIGKNAMILQNVTIGMRRFSDDEAAPESYPTIGDNVTISSGAAILGSVYLGNDSLIGANAVVLSDVPDNGIAVGIPAKLILEKETA